MQRVPEIRVSGFGSAMEKWLQAKPSSFFYKVEVFNNEITKNLSKVTRSAIKDMYRILEFYEGLKSGTIYTNENGLPNISK